MADESQLSRSESLSSELLLFSVFPLKSSACLVLLIFWYVSRLLSFSSHDIDFFYTFLFSSMSFPKVYSAYSNQYKMKSISEYEFKIYL